MKKSIGILVLLLLPVLGLGGIVAKNEWALHNSTTWRVKVSGYDPRSLFYGHYVLLRFDLPGLKGPCAEQECCLCFESSAVAPDVPKVSKRKCKEAKETCPSCVPEGAFDFEGAQRFYIPEERGPELEKALRETDREAWLEVKITPNGAVRLGELYIGDKTWQRFLADQN